MWQLNSREASFDLNTKGCQSILKKIITLTILLLISLPFIVLAGDTDYDIAIRGQDAFVIGKIIGVKGNLNSVHIEKVLMGDVEGEDIQVEKPKYPSSFENPKIGHYYVLSLDKKDAVYEIKYGGYKADSADYRTLKLEYATPGSVNERIQQFINSGRFIEADKKAKERKAEEAKKQQPIQTSLASTNETTHVNTGNLFLNGKAAFITIALIICSAAIFMFLNKKSKKEQ